MRASEMDHGLFGQIAIDDFRIVVAGTCRVDELRRQLAAHGMLSEDARIDVEEFHGCTWKLGGDVPRPAIY
ncbi:hypothetical protein GCM10027430_31570 [Lysobacter tyrosinilyticus]